MSVSSLPPLPAADELDRLITVQELAATLGLDKSSVYRLMNSGEIPAPVRVGHSVRFKLSEVRKFLAELPEHSGGDLRA